MSASAMTETRQEHEKATRTILFRATETQKRVINAAGGENVSRWIRRTLLLAANEQQRRRS